MARLTPAQRMYIRKKTNVEHVDPSEMAGELNIVPFLDIVVNLIMFLLITTMTVVAVVQIESQLPKYGRGGARAAAKEGESLNLSLTITENGITVTGSGGKLAPGCERTATGRVITVPTQGGKYDWTGLSECLIEVKEAFPDEQQVIIGADPLISYENIVEAMDASRAWEGKPLFPEVLLSGGVR